MKEKAKKELKELNDYHKQIDLNLDGNIKKISDYLSLKLQDESLKKEINSDLLKIKEAKFETNNIDNWISQTWIEYINLVDETYSKVIFYQKYF